MKFSPEEIRDLCSHNGGRFAVENIDSATIWCKRLALGHYENFPVGSLLIPAEKRPHFFSVYAFSRIGDDIADEPGFEQQERIELLEKMSQLLQYEESMSNPIFLALGQTVKQCGIPANTLLKLLTAFKRDVCFVRPVTWEDVFDYCEHSANPIGELVLRIMDSYNEENLLLSNYICTALQLTNFWQDTSTDIKRGRIYYPISLNESLMFEESNLGNQEFYAKFSDVLKKSIIVTNELFDKGEKLVCRLQKLRLRLEIAATISGGRYVLNRVERSNSEILHNRPALSALALPSLFYNSLKLLFG